MSQNSRITGIQVVQSQVYYHTELEKVKMFRDLITAEVVNYLIELNRHPSDENPPVINLNTLVPYVDKTLTLAMNYRKSGYQVIKEAMLGSDYSDVQVRIATSVCTTINRLS